MEDTCIAGVEEALELLVQKQTNLPWEITSVQSTNDEMGIILTWAFSMPIGPEDNDEPKGDQDPRSILRVSAQSDTGNGITKLYGIRLDNNGMEALYILKMFHE